MPDGILGPTFVSYFWMKYSPIKVAHYEDLLRNWSIVLNIPSDPGMAYDRGSTFT